MEALASRSGSSHCRRTSRCWRRILPLGRTTEARSTLLICAGTGRKRTDSVIDRLLRYRSGEDIAACLRPNRALNHTCQGARGQGKLRSRARGPQVHAEHMAARARSARIQGHVHGLLLGILPSLRRSLRSTVLIGWCCRFATRRKQTFSARFRWGWVCRKNSWAHAMLQATTSCGSCIIPGTAVRRYSSCIY